MVEVVTAKPSLRQESVIAIADRELTVVSEVLLEPEEMIVTSVLDNGEIIRRSHVVLPPSSRNEGAPSDGLRLALQGHHLRLLRTLMTGDRDRDDSTVVEFRAGVLGGLLLGSDGQLLAKSGEDQIPAGWLRAAYLAIGLAAALKHEFDAGDLKSIEIHGTGIRASLVSEDDKTRVTYYDGSAKTEAHSAQGPNGD